MNWKPSKGVGLFSGFVIGFTLIGVQWILGTSMLRQNLGTGMYLVGLVLLMTAMITFIWVWNLYGLMRLHYHLDRNGLTIAGGGFKRTIPMNEIQSVQHSWIDDLPKLKGVRWPGYIKGHMELDGKPLLIYSTDPLARQLMVITESAVYGISPRDPARFLADLTARQGLGMVRDTPEQVEFSGIAAWPVWRDHLFWLPMALALATNLMLIGLIFDRYGSLPERLPLHFNSLGQADRIDSKVWLLIVPGIGDLALGFNALIGVLVHHRERLASRLLAWTALGIQAILWLAALGILNR